MDKKKGPLVPSQEKNEELDEAQLGQVSGGFEVRVLPRYAVKLKFGQAMEQPSCFTKSDDFQMENKGD